MKVAFFVLFLLVGLALLLGAVFKWEYLFKSRKVRALVEGTHLEYGQILYGVIGIVLIILALVTILVPEAGETLSGRPDATVFLSVEPDGCTVTRSEVVGSAEITNFMWKVTNADYQTLLTRSGEDSMSFKYNKAGENFVVMQTFHNGGYVTISNKVKIDCK